MKRITLLTLILLWAACTFAQDVLVTPPATATTETWYRADGKFFVNTSSGWTDATGYIPTVNVIIDGSDIYIQGQLDILDSQIKMLMESMGISQKDLEDFMYSGSFEN